MLLSFLTVPVALLTATVSAYTNPLACTGVCTNAHDPAVIQRTVDGKYFRFSTGGGIAIHTSQSSILGSWSYAGEALAGGSSIDNSGAADMWAPDVTKIGDLYYLYYAVSSFGTQNSVIGLATSKTMEVGSWTDHGSVGISSDSTKAYNAIDPNLITASDGSYKMNFGSFWHDIYQAPMKATPTAVSSSSANIAYYGGTHNIEGAYMILREGYYYLFFSQGQCCGYDSSKPASGGEYKVMVCRSQTINSGFVDKSGVSCTAGGGTIVLESHGNVYGPGGQSVYQDATLGWVLFYHYVDTTIGYADGDKRLGVNKISWSGGWPSI